MKPQLARTLGPKFSSFPCFCQPKLNGVRALYQNGVFQSRDEKLWKPQVLEHLLWELDFEFDGPPLDGELYVHGWRLQRINGAIAVNRKEPNDDTRKVEFHVFDVVDPQKLFSDRWFEVYHGLITADLPHIRAVPTTLATSRADLDNHFHLYTREGYEGIMLRPDGPYEYGEHMAKHGQNMTSYRSRFLWKFKQWEDDEFQVIGSVVGTGKADIGVGSLTCINPAGTAFGVGTGFTDEERVEFMANQPARIKVRYLELTADGIPFNPSFLCVMD